VHLQNYCGYKEIQPGRVVLRQEIALLKLVDQIGQVFRWDNYIVIATNYKSKSG